MTETESAIYTERLAEREHLGDRISLIRGACEVFRRGFDEGVFAFNSFVNRTVTNTF